MAHVDKLLQEHITKLLPRRINFKLASQGTGFIQPSCRYKPLNPGSTLVFDSNESTTKKISKKEPVLPPLPTEVGILWASESRGTGSSLRNIGQTCFINSVVQCLAYVPPFANMIQLGLHQPNCRACGFCLFCGLEKLFANMWENPGSSVTPYILTKNIRTIGKQFQIGKLGDAYDLLSCMIPILQEKTVKAYSTRSRQDIEAIFTGYTKTDHICDECQGQFMNYNPFFSLSVSVNQKNSQLIDTIKQTLEQQIHNEAYCEDCQQKTKCQTRASLTCAPRVLIVHIKKSQHKIKFSRSMDLQPLTSSPAEYELCGLITHQGNDPLSGHYSSYVRASNQLWYHFNDEESTSVSSSRVEGASPYILFYCMTNKANQALQPQRAITPEPTPEAVDEDAGVLEPMEVEEAQEEADDQGDEEEVEDDQPPSQEQSDEEEEEPIQTQQGNGQQPQSHIVETVEGFSLLHQLEHGPNSLFGATSGWDSEPSVGKEQQTNYLRSINETKRKQENKKRKEREWDKELDRGKVKKVKKEKDRMLSSEKNQFQKVHDMMEKGLHKGRVFAEETSGGERGRGRGGRGGGGRGRGGGSDGERIGGGEGFEDWDLGGGGGGRDRDGYDGGRGGRGGGGRGGGGRGGGGRGRGGGGGGRGGFSNRGGGGGGRGGGRGRGGFSPRGRGK